MNHYKVLPRTLLMALVLLLGPAHTTASPVATANVVAQIISESSHVRPGSSFSVALQLDIREGWHTYWRNSGDSGQATAIQWDLPSGVTAGAIQWPYPERHYVGPLANYGYHGTAMHLVEMTLSPDWPVGKPIELSATANWLVCEEECIPEKAILNTQLATSDSNRLDPQLTQIFTAIRSSLPTPLSIRAGYHYVADRSQIRLEFAPAAPLVNARTLAYFPIDWGFISASSEQQVVIDKSFVSIMTNKGDLTFSQPVDGVIVATQENGTRQAYAVTSHAGTLINRASTDGLAQVRPANSIVNPGLAMLLAFVGGVLLNLMPCVFPVLFVKALSLVSHSGSSASTNRKHGIAYTIGILTCFALLGTVLLLLKTGGQQIGWGFQLQSPLFVSVMALVLFLLGLSLSGVFDVGTSIMGAGSNLANMAGYKGSFFTGVLAVVVATPCTAPFMGPAVGYALTQTVPVTMAVLLSLGAGLALPYLLFSFMPVLTRLLPKPGPWMTRFQQFLAFPMYASAAWLIWVLGQQSGIDGVFIILLLCVLAAFTAWLWQVTRTAVRLWQRLGTTLCVVLVVVLMGTLTMQLPRSAPLETSETASALSYQRYDQATLARLRDTGRPVFVNMTAAWCITCLANEKVALSSRELVDYFRKHDIVYMKGDWTNQDNRITAFLATFGRASVPLYVYYPPHSGQPIVLPQLLTTATVIEFIEASRADAVVSKRTFP